MGYFSDVYSSPEKHGLTMLGEVDFSDGCYNFDYTAVWKRDSDGALLYGDDSGCSCPSPFEYQTVDELTVATFAEIQAHLEGRQKDTFNGNSHVEIAELLERLR